MSSEVLRISRPVLPTSGATPASISSSVLASPDIHDLVFSYLRLGDPRLKSAAIAAIRAMAAEPRFPG
jgi:hypothetical protein